MVPVPFKGEKIKKIEELFLVFILICYSFTSIKSIGEHVFSEYGQIEEATLQKIKI